MRISTFLICDAANTTPDGKVNILGGAITQIRPPAYPFSFQPHLVMIVEAEPTEAGKHQMTLNFIEDDGRALAAVRVDFETGIGIDCTIVIQWLLPVPKAGRYRFDAQIDGAPQPLNRPFKAL